MADDVMRLLDDVEQPATEAICVMHRYLHGGGKQFEFIEVRRAGCVQWIITTPDDHAHVARLPVKAESSPWPRRLLIVTDELYDEFAGAHLHGTIEYDCEAAARGAPKFLHVSGEATNLLKEDPAEGVVSPSAFRAHTVAAATGAGIAQIGGDLSQLLDGSLALVSGLWGLGEVFEFAMQYSNNATPFIGAARMGAIPVWVYLTGSKQGLPIAMRFGGAVAFAAVAGWCIGKGIDTTITTLAGKPLGVLLYDTFVDSEAAAASPLRPSGSSHETGDARRMTVLGAQEAWIAREPREPEPPGGATAASGSSTTPEPPATGTLTLFIRSGERTWVCAGESCSEVTVDEKGQPVSRTPLPPPGDDMCPDGEDGADGQEDGDDSKQAGAWLRELRKQARRASVSTSRWRKFAPLIHVSPDHPHSAGGTPIKPSPGPAPAPAPERELGKIEDPLKPKPGGPDPDSFYTLDRATSLITFRRTYAKKDSLEPQG